MTNDKELGIERFHVAVATASCHPKAKRAKNATPRQASFANLVVNSKFTIKLSISSLCPVMSSLKETRYLLLVSFIKRVTKANEFAILYDVTISDSSLRYCESWMCIQILRYLAPCRTTLFGANLEFKGFS